MTGSRRILGLAFALAVPALAFPAPRSADELHDTFAAAVDHYQRGQNAEALADLQRALAMEPSQEAAYDLWKSTDYRDWRDFLVEGGQFELAAKRLIELARLGRKAIANDEARIQPLVVQAVTGDDAMERRRALLTLSSDHGEYAVPYFVPYLSSENGDEDRRVLAMHALSHMDADVVPPLAAALASDDAILRRNIVMVLGNVGDPRAKAHVLGAAATDPDESVRQAARQSAERLGASGDALSAFLELGDSYHNRRSDVLGPRGTGEAVWTYHDRTLVAETVPQALYNEEMSLRAYARALEVNPSSNAALAGMARAWMAERAEIEAMEASGADVGTWKERADAAGALVNSAGAAALDTALTWSARGNDSVSGAAIARALGDLATAPTPGLEAALRSNDGAMRSEAAVALAHIASRSGMPASAEVVSILGQACGRQVQRLAAVIGSTDAAGQVASALRQRGVFVSHWDTGAKGATMVRRAHGLDVIVVADTLPDLTVAQVVDEIKADERTQAVPVVLLAADPAAVAEAWGDRIAGATSGTGDLSAIDAALETELEGDRARAATLATRSAQALAHLAHVPGADLSGALAGLTAAVARDDAVAVPAIHALGGAGGPGEATPLVAVLADEARSEEARTAAGNALAGILARSPGALGGDAIAQVAAVAGSEAPVSVREAASRAIGRANLDAAARAELLRKLRG